MKYKNMVIFVLTIFVLISISGVSAGDANDAVIASDDTKEIELSKSSEIENDTLQTGSEDVPLTQKGNDELLSTENDLKLLSNNSGTYSGLSSEINSGSYIKLQHDYYTYDSGSTIEISTYNSVIDGNGAVIDMAGTNIRAFTVSASDVTIKNLTIKNTNYNGKGRGNLL